MNKKINNNNILNNLNKYRIFKGLTQQDLSKELNISCQLIRKIETENHFPKYNLRSKICKYFNVSHNQMFYEIQKVNCIYCGDEMPQNQMYKTIGNKMNQADLYICSSCKKGDF